MTKYFRYIYIYQNIFVSLHKDIKHSAKIMENIQTSNTFEEKSQKITLKGYYKGLPMRSAPRYDFITEVARRCKVTEQTVRNWVLYGMKPQQHAHIEVLSKLTGISEEDLWKD